MLLSDLSHQDRRDALQRLLDSRTFRRSEQLKKLVFYLCDAELEGRREQLDEYRIGVEALGRREDFSPEIDSSVRTRTHALRQKLSEYYASEGAAEKVRIEVPRGSYVPEFRSRDALLPDLPGELPVPPSVISAPPASESSPAKSPWRFRIGVAAAVALATMGAFRLQWVTVGPALATPSIVRDFWKPVLESGQPVAICVAQPVHVWLRDYHDAVPPKGQYQPLEARLPDGGALQEYYRVRTGRMPSANLVFHPSPNSPLWGDSAGASGAVKFLESQRVASELLPESTLRNSYPLKGRNALVFGREEFSELVKELTPGGGYRQTYLESERRYAIVHEGDARQRFYNSPRTDLENFGLITVSRSPTELQAVFSGITSDGAQAGIDFLTSAEGLERIYREFGSKWPVKFQVVVRTRSINGYPMKTEYAAKHVF